MKDPVCKRRRRMGRSPANEALNKSLTDDGAELPEFVASTHAGESAEAKALMGCCLAVRRDVLDKHGLLCEETELGADGAGVWLF